MGTFRLEATKTESLPPDESKAGDIFSRLGYGIADAIADIVDNSVDAGASRVHVRFAKSVKGIHSVLIADNGSGMGDKDLREAMRFGSRSTKSGQQLGKYGIGLKSASLSQAETVTVVSRKGGTMVGRRWTLENVKKNWSCEVLRTADLGAVFKPQYGDFHIDKTGTVVVWERLEHLRALPEHLDQVLQKTRRELSIELGIRFHRFIENGSLAISIDEQIGLDEHSGIPVFVSALNPFSYEVSGHSDYPANLRLKINGTSVTAECHIWPPKSTVPGYKLGGGKVALRQGFYFYRNDRVIQAGGWNGVRADDGEPHLSLARVKVDLPSALDSMFKLDVTKSRLDPAPMFISELLHAVSSRGITYEQYIGHAQATYRKQKKKEAARFPLIPGTGISVSAQRAIATILEEEGVGRPKKVTFKWTKLDIDEVVRVDADHDVIHLNSRFKKYLSEGSSSDAPVLKVALMFLLQGELEKSRVTKQAQGWLQRVNASLLASLKE
jgi:hypothetical protein